MNRKQTIAALAAFAAVALAPVGAAFALGAGIGGGGVSGFSVGGLTAASVGNIGVNEASVLQLKGSTLSANPDSFSAASNHNELPIAGRVAARSTLPEGATLVHLRVNGRTISMALDTKVPIAELDANPADDNNKALYNSVLSKQMVVIGTRELRDQIMAAADSSKPLVLQGYVFDRTSPYFMVRSASDINERAD
jgi:hypothetical protein